MGDPPELEGVFHGSDNVGLPDHIVKLLRPPSSGNNSVTHGLKPSSELPVRSSEINIIAFDSRLACLYFNNGGFISGFSYVILYPYGYSRA